MEVPKLVALQNYFLLSRQYQGQKLSPSNLIKEGSFLYQGKTVVFLLNLP